MTVEIEGTDLVVEKDGTLGVAIAGNGTEIRTPPFHARTVVGEDVFIMVSATNDARDADFEVPSAERNVVRIERSCRVGWFVAEATDYNAEVDGYTHDTFYDLEDRLITKADTGRFFEIDPETGAIEDSWPELAFTFDGKRVNLKYPIDHAAVIDGVRMLVANGEDFGSVVYGFDADGSKRWERGFSENLIQLRETSDGNAGLAKMRGGFALDPATGDVV